MPNMEVPSIAHANQSLPFRVMDRCYLQNKKSHGPKQTISGLMKCGCRLETNRLCFTAFTELVLEKTRHLSVMTEQENVVVSLEDKREKQGLGAEMSLSQAREEYPETDLSIGIVGWESQQDPSNPR